MIATAFLAFASFAAANQPTVDSVLKWLPADTETLLVAQTPFQLPSKDAELSVDATQMAKIFTLGMFSAAEHEALPKALAGQSLRFSVVAARHFGFREDDGVGVGSYEGCAFYAFAVPFGGPPFARKPEETLSGQSVWTSTGSENESSYKYTYRTTLLKPDMLLICNSAEYFRSVVTSASSADAPRQALPANLKEWKNVDHGTPFWGVRHFPRPLSADDELQPTAGRGDPLALGCTVEIGAPAHTVMVHWLSATKRNVWETLAASDELKGQATSRMTPAGWDLSIKPKNEESVPLAVFAALSSLGFVVKY